MTTNYNIYLDKPSADSVDDALLIMERLLAQNPKALRSIHGKQLEKTWNNFPEHLLYFLGDIVSGAVGIAGEGNVYGLHHTYILKNLLLMGRRKGTKDLPVKFEVTKEQANWIIQVLEARRRLVMGQLSIAMEIFENASYHAAKMDGRDYDPRPDPAELSVSRKLIAEMEKLYTSILKNNISGNNTNKSSGLFIPEGIEEGTTVLQALRYRLACDANTNNDPAAWVAPPEIYGNVKFLPIVEKSS